MKLNLNTKDLNEFQKILDTKDINMSIADLYLEYLEYYKNSFLYDKNNKTSFEEQFLKHFLHKMEIDPKNKENKEIIENYLLPGIKCLNEEKYLNNPYIKNIVIKDKRNAILLLTNLTYKPFEAFSYNDIEVNENAYYKEISRIGFFKKPYTFPALLENNVIWMSINPNEIETMEKSINEAKGNILVFGLGLGYYQYMTSLKEEVKSITIIENNQKIIDIFNTCILPQFTNKNKIKIIKDDAFNYINKCDKNEFDFIFVDFWHNPNDGLETYLYFKKLENTFNNTIFSYWLEEGILALLRRSLISLIEEELDGSSDIDYKIQDTLFDKIISKLHFFLKNSTFNSFIEIKKLLSDESLKSLATKL